MLNPIEGKENNMEITMIKMLNNLDDEILIKMAENGTLANLCFGLSLDMHSSSPYDIEIQC